MPQNSRIRPASLPLVHPGKILPSRASHCRGPSTPHSSMGSATISQPCVIAYSPSTLATKTRVFHCVFENGVARQYLYKIAADCLIDVSGFVDVPISRNLKALEDTRRPVIHPLSTGFTMMTKHRIPSGLGGTLTSLTSTRRHRWSASKWIQVTIREWVNHVIKSVKPWIGERSIRDKKLEIRFFERLLYECLGRLIF